VKKCSYLIIFIFYLITLSCNKEPKIEPVCYPDREIDLNNDLIPDIKISYSGYTWDGIGPNGTGMGIEGYLVPINDTKILTSEEKGVLYYKGSIEIKQQIELPYFWAYNRAFLVKIETVNNGYSKPWIVFAPEPKEYWYAGYLIKKDNQDIVGWMKIRINSYTGLITIEGTKSILSGSLVIGN